MSSKKKTTPPAQPAVDPQRVADTIACVNQVTIRIRDLIEVCIDPGASSQTADEHESALRTALLDLAGIPLDAPGR